MIRNDHAPAPHGIGRNRALLWKQPHTGKALGQLAIRLFSNQLVSGLAAPKINAGAMEEAAGRRTEKLNQSRGIGAFRRFAGNAQQKLLKVLVGGKWRRDWWWDRIALGEIQSITGIAGCQFSQVIETIGKISCHLILSQEKCR
jgi:hypothetical protein